MEPEEIAEKIRIILDANTESISTFYSTKDNKQSLDSKGQFSNEYVELLLQLESRINIPTSKDFFWNLMGIGFASSIPKITSGPSAIMILKAVAQIQKHSDCAFMVYLKSGKIDEALKGAFERIKDYSSVNETNNKIILCISQVLSMESHLFSNDDLRIIESMASKYQSCINEAFSWHNNQKKRQIQFTAQEMADFLTTPTYPETPKEEIPTMLPPLDRIVRSNDLLTNFQNTLRQVRFEKIREELRGVSTEINQDKNQLIRKYRDLKLSRNLIDGFEKLDAETEQTGSRFSYSKSIGFVRNLYEESLREFALKIRDITGEDIPNWKDKGEMGVAISYFRSKKINIISEKELLFLTGFSGLLSDSGSHRLTSERYEVRIAKNVLVEICSYLFNKIENFISVHHQ